MFKNYKDKQLKHYKTKVRIPNPKPTIWHKDKSKYDRKINELAIREDLKASGSVDDINGDF